ncbi:MAG: hypothetical protein ACR2PH_05580 [Desulfobulbia bacterium]
MGEQIKPNPEKILEELEHQVKLVQRYIHPSNENDHLHTFRKEIESYEILVFTLERVKKKADIVIRNLKEEIKGNEKFMQFLNKNPREHTLLRALFTTDPNIIDESLKDQEQVKK